MNKNFKHRRIYTLGGSELVGFIGEQRVKNWSRHNNIVGGSKNSYYYIDESGYIQCDSSIAYRVGWNEITVEGFINHYKDMLSPLDDKSIHVARKEFKRIYDVACDRWRSTLTEWCSKNPFDDMLTFTPQQVTDMINASTPSQLEIVKSVFNEYIEAELDLREMDFNGELFAESGGHAMIAINHEDFKSFYLSNDYTWELSTHRDGNSVLTPTRK